MSKALNVQPRRQPRQIRSDRRVSKILDAAIHVFAELGFEGTTTTAIAARADVSVGSLYQYFPNKTAIVHALSDRFDAAFFIALDGVLTVTVYMYICAALLAAACAAMYIYLGRSGAARFAAL